MDKLRLASQMTTSAQLDRLCSRQKWVNPYQVLMLPSDTPDQQIRSRFRKISVLVHPDKTKDQRALHAFRIVELAYRTLQDQQKKQWFQRILRQAKQRVEFQRKLQNRRRQMLGLMKLPDDTFQSQVSEMANKIFREIQERKCSFDKFEFMARKRQREEEEKRREMEEKRMEEEKEWERSRDKRVNQWRKFQNRKVKTHAKRKLKSFEMKPPAAKMEQRRMQANFS